MLAHALPDLHPFTAVAPHLDLLLGSGATAVGISQQGLAAPFTALRVVAAYQRSGRSTRAVVAVLEQATLPVHFALAHDTPLTDSGVLLLLGTGDGPALGGVESLPPGVPPGARVAELTAADPGAPSSSPAPGCRRGPPARARTSTAPPAARTARACGWPWPGTGAPGGRSTPPSSCATPTR
ncbi:hypothetical protein ACFQ2B_05425 [Streptomyces stramineus]